MEARMEEVQKHPTSREGNTPISCFCYYSYNTRTAPQSTPSSYSFPTICYKSGFDIAILY